MIATVAIVVAVVVVVVVDVDVAAVVARLLNDVANARRCGTLIVIRGHFHQPNDVKYKGTSNGEIVLFYLHLYCNKST